MQNAAPTMVTGPKKNEFELFTETQLGRDFKKFVGDELYEAFCISLRVKENSGVYAFSIGGGKFYLNFAEKELFRFFGSTQESQSVEFTIDLSENLIAKNKSKTPNEPHLKAGMHNNTLETLPPDTYTELLQQDPSYDWDFFISNHIVDATQDKSEITFAPSNLDGVSSAKNLQTRRTTAERIIKIVCDFYKVKESDIKGPRKTRNLSFPRQIAMYLITQNTELSLPQNGKKFDRGHTTVMHARREIEKLLADSPEFADDLKKMQDTI